MCGSATTLQRLWRCRKVSSPRSENGEGDVLDKVVVGGSGLRRAAALRGGARDERALERRAAGAAPDRQARAGARPAAGAGQAGVLAARARRRGPAVPRALRQGGGTNLAVALATRSAARHARFSSNRLESVLNRSVAFLQRALSTLHLMQKNGLIAHGL